MPFPNQTPRPFTRDGIEWLNPDQYGCYGLFREGKWIYVGKGDIRSRLLDHLDGDDPLIIVEAPTHFVAVVTTNPDAVEMQLIAELDPIANRRPG
jgi:excinuclease UvrABC nuclease subunit